MKSLLFLLLVLNSLHEYKLDVEQKIQSVERLIAAYADSLLLMEDKH